MLRIVRARAGPVVPGEELPGGAEVGLPPAIAHSGPQTRAAVVFRAPVASAAVEPGTDLRVERSPGGTVPERRVPGPEPRGVGVAGARVTHREGARHGAAPELRPRARVVVPIA